GYLNAAREGLHAFFHGAFAVPPEVISQDDAHAVPYSSSLTRAVVERQDVFAKSASQIDVPVLLTLGQEDLTDAPFRVRELNLYTSSNPRSLYIHEGAAHCGNFAPTRRDLWRILAWFVQWAWAISEGAPHPLPPGERAERSAWINQTA